MNLNWINKGINVHKIVVTAYVYRVINDTKFF